MQFAVQYLYLEPEPSVVEANTARSAASEYLAAKGGPDRNWGRTVVVKGLEGGTENRWALIREDQTLHRIDEHGNSLPA